MSVPICLSKIVRNGLIRTPQVSYFGSTAIRHSKLWEPDYLILAKTKTPEYDLVNVQIKGFDFPILENYQKCIHRLAKCFDIDVENGWATPHQDLLVKKYKPNSTIVESEYQLKLYERNIQVVDVKSHVMPLFLEAIITACPVGVRISVHEHEPDMEECRYVPDFDYLELKKKLEDMRKKK